MDAELGARVARAKTLIWEAVRRHLADGGRMAGGVWGVERVAVEGEPGHTTWVPRKDSGCCPMGCMLIGQTTASAQPWAGIEKVKKLLDLVDDNDGTAFMQGYDARPRADLFENPWFQLGLQARLEFGP